MNFKKLADQEILILGLGREGTSTLHYLRKKFPTKYLAVADQKNIDQLEKDNQLVIKKDKFLKLHLGENYQKYLNQFDIIFKSPGIKLEKSTKAKVISQTQIFLGLFKEKIIGVTGTKGKTTTSSLIYQILKDAKMKVLLVGNIGNPPFDVIEKAPTIDFAVYELSSFQLQGLKVSPHISVFLNLYQEHLDYHGGFENYKKSKANIINWQNKDDTVIYNADSEIVSKIVEKDEATKIPYSLNKKLKAGVYINGEWIYFNDEKVLKAKETNLRGKFNLNNILAAVSVAKTLKISNNSIASSVKSFQPVKHRLEYIGAFKGIDFYNDSIATIPEATIAALETLKPNVSTLIVGGYNRGIDYSLLSKKIVEEKISNIILLPETGKIILAGINNKKEYKPNYLFVKNMKEAVKTAARFTEKGKICLMSPASSSFNLFKNYQDRGEQFAKYVQDLK